MSNSEPCGRPWESHLLLELQLTQATGSSIQHAHYSMKGGLGGLHPVVDVLQVGHHRACQAQQQGSRIGYFQP